MAFPRFETTGDAESRLSRDRDEREESVPCVAARDQPRPWGEIFFNRKHGRSSFLIKLTTIAQTQTNENNNYTGWCRRWRNPQGSLLRRVRSIHY